MNIQQQSVELDTLSVDNLESRKKVLLVLDAIALLPMANLAALNNKRLVPYISEITGLSDSRILQGRLDQLRSSKMKAVEEHSKAYFRERALGLGWSGEDYDAHFASTPLRSNGLPGFYSSWIHSLGQSVFSLPHTEAIALRLDEIIGASVDAAAADDIYVFTEQWADFYHTTPGCDQRFSQGEIEKQNMEVLAWRGATSWEDIEPLLDKKLQSLFWDLFACFDAEWASKFLPGMAPMPIFLWIAPRINEKIRPGPIPKKHRNFIYRPVRRLLEFSHALAYWHYIGEWPCKSAGRTELSEKFEIPDHTVGNYFDGTRRLDLRSYQTYWTKMAAKFSNIAGEQDSDLWIPYHLAIVAILWQDILVKTTNELKFLSAIVIDEDDYRRTWEGYRRFWGIKAEPEPMAWPEWLSKQCLFANSDATPLHTV